MPESVIPKGDTDNIFEDYGKMPGLKSDFDVASAIYTDWIWQCPQQMLANASVALGNPVWRGYINKSLDEALPEKYSYLGKFHGADMILLFYVAARHDRGDEMPADLVSFARELRSAIGSFVRDPRAGPGWPAIGSPSAPSDVAVLGGNRTMIDRNVLDANCAIFADALAKVEKSSAAW
ncbi:hypothetical protein CDD80_5874 [Ophiocordyceps camponoti-rufipedis]|uniref:Carboxylesterase type B domain-containing protein n=1 Tax=Ophiocordyceps camponoti-rufipedis TaxID=2004952 RepID=A0A2C5YSP5_9HYPO|nr:hypothetical protein CDD80_5874 [Ophiocordyceps camponoti-rufipedis]